MVVGVIVDQRVELLGGRACYHEWPDEVHQLSVELRGLSQVVTFLGIVNRWFDHSSLTILISQKNEYFCWTVRAFLDEVTNIDRLRAARFRKFRVLEFNSLDSKSHSESRSSLAVNLSINANRVTHCVVSIENCDARRRTIVASHQASRKTDDDQKTADEYRDS